MNYTEKEKDIFTAPDDYYLAHCIASDLGMGAGIAVPMQKKFNLRAEIKKSGYDGRYPYCVMTGRVFNLITKKRSNGKPTHESLAKALTHLRDLVKLHKIKKLAMPKIGCGLDRLDWAEVRYYILSTFSDLDIDILVCVWE